MLWGKKGIMEGDEGDGEGGGEGLLYMKWFCPYLV